MLTHLRYYRKKNDNLSLESINNLKLWKLEDEKEIEALSALIQ